MHSTAQKDTSILQEDTSTPSDPSSFRLPPASEPPSSFLASDLSVGLCHLTCRAQDNDTYAAAVLAHIRDQAGQLAILQRLTRRLAIVARGRLLRIADLDRRLVIAERASLPSTFQGEGQGGGSAGPGGGGDPADEIEDPPGLRRSQIAAALGQQALTPPERIQP